MEVEQNDSPRRLYLDDLVVGDEFCSGEHKLDAEQIIAFASEFDPQPFHLDEEAAKATFFQGLAASGWQTMALTMRLMVESVPLAGGLIGLGGEIHWPRPTRPTDVLHVKSRVVEIRPSRSKPDRAIVLIEFNTFNQNQELLQQFTGKVLSFKKPQADSI